MQKWEGEQNATKPADEDIEAAGAMVPMGAKVAMPGPETREEGWKEHIESNLATLVSSI